MSPPKVFVSHASEDKSRFVVDFARRLRENGVDAWLDQWEMKPGDSLVDKIFEEGLKDARAVIVVLSKSSVQKPWVREELNASVVNRISRGTRLIPVVIDDCEVPESLRSTVWQRVDDVNDYGESLQRILSAIFDVSDKPTIGNTPARFGGAAPLIPGLSRVDDLDQDSKLLSGIFGARIQIELTKLAANRVLLNTRIGETTTREEFTGNFRELADELLRARNQSFKTVRGATIELCQLQGQSFTVQAGQPQSLINCRKDE